MNGGGGGHSELVITWEVRFVFEIRKFVACSRHSSLLGRVLPLQPVPEELQSGSGFGYVVAFRPLGAQGWMQAAVTSPEASRYVFKNESIPPFSPYQVKVGVYNNRGEGPFSPVTTIHSAEEGWSHFQYNTNRWRRLLVERD